MIYTVDEHNKTLESIDILKTNIDILKSNHEKEKNKIQKEHEVEIDLIKTNTQDKLKESNDKLFEALNDIAQLKNINQNLKRIATERANAQRKIIPKKSHIGYILLNIDEITIVHKDESNRQTEFTPLPCWKIRFQTPYDISLEYKAVKNLIYDDMIEKFGAKIGIKSVQSNNNIEKLKSNDVIKLWHEKDNFIFKSTYKANAIKGFWEVEYLTRFAIKVLPEMRISQPNPCK